TSVPSLVTAGGSRDPTVYVSWNDPATLDAGQLAGYRLTRVVPPPVGSGVGAPWSNVTWFFDERANPHRFVDHPPTVSVSYVLDTLRTSDGRTVAADTARRQGLARLRRVRRVPRVQCLVRRQAERRSPLPGPRHPGRDLRARRERHGRRRRLREHEPARHDR